VPLSNNTSLIPRYQKNVQWSTGSSIPQIIKISWICSITFFYDLKCVLILPNPCKKVLAI
jgi:hypothetical protein